MSNLKLLNVITSANGVLFLVLFVCVFVYVGVFAGLLQK